MINATLYLNSNFVIDTVDKRIFGGFLEHLGRCIYRGVYDPQHPASDDGGLRDDLLQALRDLEVTIVRYPGGNFVSGYHWEDGIGPRSARPTVRDLAWQSTEPNTFGTDEFLKLCRKLEWLPMLAVNLGTGTAEEARNWVEYCNAEVGTKYSDQRADGSSVDPWGVPVWCLGNEMDGPWQLGHVPVEEYCNRAQMAAKMMKDCDPNIELVACGSSGPQMATFLDWDRQVLGRLGGRLADYISLHRYVGNPNDDSAEYLAISNSIDAQIEAVDAAAKYTAALHKSSRRTYLCFDEWNVWYRARTAEHVDGRGKFAPTLLEETYNFEDALVVAAFLMSFIRHADSVKVANLAQLVNVIAPLRTSAERVLRQTIFHAFRLVSSRKGGVALRQAVDCDSYETTSYGDVRYLDSAATLDGNKLNVFLLNRHLVEPMSLTVECSALDLTELQHGEILTHSDLKAQNDWDSPNVVSAELFTSIDVTPRSLKLEIPPHSFVAATVGVA